MKNINHPMWKDVMAFASEILTHDDKQIMREIIKTYAEQTSEEVDAERNCQAMKDAIDGDLDTNDYDVIVGLAADFLRDGHRLPYELAKFAADVLEGKRSRPTKPGPDPYRYSPRNYVLSFTTEAVAKKFNIARYEKGNTNKETAVDAVSEAAKCTKAMVTHALGSHPIDPSITAIVAARLGAKLDS